MPFLALLGVIRPGGVCRSGRTSASGNSHGVRMGLLLCRECLPSACQHCLLPGSLLCVLLLLLLQGWGSRNHRRPK